jgi:hypothetical protein
MESIERRRRPAFCRQNWTALPLLRKAVSALRASPNLLAL